MRIQNNDVNIEYEVTGQGRPVLLLHGFPDTGRVWRKQVSVLVEAGFQVIVPDLRGFGRSDKPESVEAYAFPHLVGDVLAVLRAVGVERTHVVGHDWGAALAWVLATMVPQVVDHLAVLSVGHPATFRKTLEQKQKSWYMLLFQFVGIAERWLSDNDWANLRSFRHPDTDEVVAQLKSGNSLTASLNWYRANAAPETWVQPVVPFPSIKAPTLGIWSSGDVALCETQMTDSKLNVAGSWRYERLEGIGHWLQLEAAEAVNRLLLEFLPKWTN